MSIKTVAVLILMILFVQACGVSSKDPEYEKAQLAIEEVTTRFNNREYQKVIEQADSLLTIDRNNYALLTMKGRSLFHIGKPDKGLEAINKAIETNPDYLYAYGYRALIMSAMESSNKQQIFNDTKLALSKYPENTDFLKVKIVFLFKMGKLEEALNNCAKLLDIDPSNYAATVILGSIKKQKGDYEGALKEYKKAIELDSTQTYAYAERGYAYIEKGEYALAVNDYNRLLSNEIPNPSIRAYTLNNRGFAYHKLGDNANALKDINLSLKILPTNSYAYKNRALVAIANNDEPEACSDLNKAIDLGFTKYYGTEVEELVQKYCTKN